VKTIRNIHVIDAGRQYRIAVMGSRVLLVALRPAKPGGKERMLEIGGKRAGKLLVMAWAQEAAEQLDKGK
jgi:hypothetical protein